MVPTHSIDISRGAQLQAIEASFAACNGDDTEEFDLSKLRHPNKPNTIAVESYEVFPDAEIWANAYDLFKFSERPGERPVEARHFHFVFLLSPIRVTLTPRCIV
jgi:RNA polymerase II-associated factor 1